MSTLYNSDFAVFISPVEKATLFERFERLFTHVSPTIILSVNEGVESLSMFSVRSSIAIDLYLIRGFLKIVSELGGSVSLLRYETWDENRGIFRSNWHQPTSDPQNP